MALGCAKVNISTQLKVAFIDGFCQYHRANPEDYEPLRVIDGQYRRMEEEVVEKIRLFAGSGAFEVGKEKDA
jgi:fructose/tagatose bisphosphate aldolase